MKTQSGHKIGIVSGIGPLAGSDVLSKVFKNSALIYGAIEDSEYPDLILVNHGIEGVDNIGCLNSSFQAEIVNMVHFLESQGCDIIGIACNTAYVYLNEIKIKTQTTLINLIDAVSRSASDQDHTYLLLTSTTSKQQKLYTEYLYRHKVNYEETSQNEQLLVDEAIGLVMSYKLQEAGKLLENILASAKARGFSAVIAGCTEIPVAIGSCKDISGLKIIDSNEELAKALLNKYYQQ